MKKQDEQLLLGYRCPYCNVRLDNPRLLEGHLPRCLKWPKHATERIYELSDVVRDLIKRVRVLEGKEGDFDATNSNTDAGEAHEPGTRDSTPA